MAEWQKKTLGPAEKAYLPSKRTMERKLQRKKKEARDTQLTPELLMTWPTFLKA
jgi:hypothetical protein